MAVKEKSKKTKEPLQPIEKRNTFVKREQATVKSVKK